MSQASLDREVLRCAQNGDAQALRTMLKEGADPSAKVPPWP